MILKDILSKSIQFLKDKGFEQPRLEAEILISEALKIRRLDLYLKYEQPLSENEVQNCRDILKRRLTGEPVAYITGDKGFYGFNFKVKKGVLIPRPETELLVEYVEKFFSAKKQEPLQFLEMGFGSGCIGLSLLKLFPQSHLVAIEMSDVAYNCALENAQELQVRDRLQLIHSKVEDADFSSFQKFDAIVSNPPYIAYDDVDVQKSVKDFEPHEALFAQDYGLELLKAWSLKSEAYLKADGLMMFEMGYKQGEQMKSFFSNLNLKNIEIIKDLSGLDRFVKGVHN